MNDLVVIDDQNTSIGLFRSHYGTALHLFSSADAIYAAFVEMVLAISSCTIDSLIAFITQICDFQRATDAGDRFISSNMNR